MTNLSRAPRNAAALSAVIYQSANLPTPQRSGPPARGWLAPLPKVLQRFTLACSAESATRLRHPLFLLRDDATVRSVRVWHIAGCMEAKSLEDRVAALEAKVGSKSLQEQFREQAELIDERFLLVDRRLDGIAADIRGLRSDVNGLKSDVGGLKSDVGGLKSDVSGLKSDVSTLKSDVSTLKKEMTIVREGVAIILTKLG